jgi:hypothetical protein
LPYSSDTAVGEKRFGMWKSIYTQASEIVLTMCNSIVLAISFLLGLVLSAIGYPKEVLVFLFTLIVIDLITKQYSLIVIKFGKF